MKQLISFLSVFVFAILVTTNVQAQETQTITFNATVEPYIEINPDYLNMEFSTSINPGDAGSAVMDHGFDQASTYNDAVYANCPMQISVEGDNPAGDGEPILARQEVDGNGYDRLQTKIQLRHLLNGGNPVTGGKYFFTSDPDGAATGNWKWGKTHDFLTPHDGEVDLMVYFRARLPHASPDFGTDNTWNQSADAGDYTADLVVTYSVL